MTIDIVYRIYPLSYLWCVCLRHLVNAGTRKISLEEGCTVLDFKTWFKAERGVDIHRQTFILPYNSKKYEEENCKGDYSAELRQGLVLQDDVVFDKQHSNIFLLLFIHKLTREEKEEKKWNEPCKATKYHTRRLGVRFDSLESFTIKYRTRSCIACENLNFYF